MPQRTLRRVLFACATPAIIIGSFSPGLGPLGSRILVASGFVCLLLEVAWLREDVSKLQARLPSEKPEP